MMTEKEFVGVRRLEDFEKIHGSVQSYLSDWHGSLIQGAWGTYQALYFKQGVCIADGSYEQNFHPEECANPKSIFLFRIIADESGKIEPIRKDLNSIVRRLQESNCFPKPEHIHKRRQ